MTKQSDLCPHCGAKMKSYRQSLSRSLIDGLIRFAQMGVGVQKLSESGFSYAQRRNFQKLQYFGLVAKAGTTAHSGEWVITSYGWEFLAGNALSPSWVRTFRGRVVEMPEDRSTSISGIQHTPYFMRYGDYVAESSGVSERDLEVMKALA